MDLITTHKNADFDALSSLVAAGKLYPKARLLLPGSQEKAVRSFLSLIKDKVKIEDEKTCRMDDIKRLIIVDNRHASRIGAAAELLKKKGMKVHIYDHHPRTRFDIKGSKDVFKEVGATVSILLEIMARKGKLDFTPLEATLMLLGIYEETGSLSYSTTTKLDVDMVSALLSSGAKLNAVSSYLNRELTGSELSVLVELLESVDVVDIHGIPVAFAGTDTSDFDGELGTVVHKLQDVENYPVIFAMFTAHGRTKMLSRSRISAIDVNKIMGHFSGAGHSSAASARVEGTDLEGIRSSITGMIEKMTMPDIYARDIMSSPVKTVSQDDKVTEVLDRLERFGYKGAPVLNEDSELVGIVTAGDLKKAINRKMGHSRIKGYMATELITVDPGTPLYKLRKILMEKGKGRIPVIEGNSIVGIVTRTDVLRKVHSSLFAAGSNREPGAKDLSVKMKTSLPPKLMFLIRSIGKSGDEHGMNVFLVGGFVRDLLLGKKNYDLDIVVEGDAIRFGEILAEKMKGTLVTHPKFGTSTVVNKWPKWLGSSLHADNKFKIDIATARKEVYKKPAALPTVEFSSLREDLYRRDFTVNAMAVAVNKTHFGMFIDFFGGVKDLEKKTIRILHDKSFIDDPTRIFRAVRFEQRLGFSIDDHTEYLIQHAVSQDMFKRTENQRIRDELILMLKEKNPDKAVFRMRELHELRFIHPELVLKRSMRKTLGSLRKCENWYAGKALGARPLDIWLMNFMIMLDGLTGPEMDDVLEKFVFTRSGRLKLSSYKKEAKNAITRLSSRNRMLPSRVYDILEPLAHEVTLCIMARTGSETARRRIRRFFSEYNGITLRVKGGDLKKEGLKPGPSYKAILRKVLCEKIDGKLKSKKDELAYMRALIEKRA